MFSNATANYGYNWALEEKLLDVYLSLSPFYFLFIYFLRDCLSQCLDFEVSEMAESGLEVRLGTSPQVAPQPDANLYWVSGGSNQAVVEQSAQPDEPQVKSQDRFRARYLLAIITIVCLALAFGVGFGVGLPAKHKPSLSG